MKRWKPDGWISMVSVPVELGAADWKSFAEVRRIVFGEWMIHGSEAASSAEAIGISLFFAGCGSQSSVGTFLHLRHRSAILCLRLGL